MEALTNLEDYQKKLSHPSKVMALYLYTDWCGPCWRMYPLLDAWQKAHPDQLYFYKANIDEFPQLIDDFILKNVPIAVFYYQDIEIYRIKGWYDVEVIEKKMERVMSFVK